MALSMIDFGEWMPDQAGITGALQEAYNVVPQAIGYAPLPNTADFSGNASENLTNLFATKYGGTTTVFASGTTKLFKFDSNDLSLDNVSKSGGYTTADRFYFVQYGQKLIAANGNSKLQAWDLGSSTTFDDLSADAPTAKFVTVVRDFVVAANTASAPNTVYWSDINDETDWTPSDTSQSDSQTIPDGGDIRGITGGEFGIVLLEKSIVRMSYIGSPLFFQFDTIAKNIGCYEANSVAQHGNMTFFLSDDGFYMTDGQAVMPIGAEKVDRYFYTFVDQSKISKMSAAVDTVRKIVMWQFTDIFAQKRLIIYNWQSKKWSYGETSTDYLASSASAGVTLEALDTFGTMDSIQTSFDDRLWAGGKFVMSGVEGTKIVTFTGQPKTGYITTGDLGNGNQSIVMLAKPKIDTGSASVSVASRALLSEVPSFGTPVVADAENRVSLRSSGKWHRIRVYPSGANWKNAVGVEVDLVSQGGR
jgi:hypothetical protein